MWAARLLVAIIRSPWRISMWALCRARKCLEVGSGAAAALEKPPAKKRKIAEVHISFEEQQEPPITVSTDILCSAMRFLTRGELDSIPLVSRRFSKLAHHDLSTISNRIHSTGDWRKKKKKKSVPLFPQCRVVEVFEVRGAEGCYHFVLKEEVAVCYPRFITAFSSSASSPHGPGWVEYRVKRGGLFPNYSLANLRAHQTIVHLASSVNAWAGSMEAVSAEFAHVWKGRALKISIPNPTASSWMFFWRQQRHLISPAAAVGVLGMGGEDSSGASSPSILEVEGGEFEWKGEGVEAASASATCGLLGAYFQGGGWATSPCLCIDINTAECWGIHYDHIVDYLFSGRETGEEKWLSIKNLRYPPAQQLDYAPAKLKKMVEERFKLHAAISPLLPPVHFTMLLTLEYPENAEGWLVGEFELAAINANEEEKAEQAPPLDLFREYRRFTSSVLEGRNNRNALLLRIESGTELLDFE